MTERVFQIEMLQCTVICCLVNLTSFNSDHRRNRIIRARGVVRGKARGVARGLAKVRARGVCGAVSYIACIQ
jgi:hypothetical protein